MNARELAIEIAWRAWGLPYRWGGDDPLKGFDCSGFIRELMASTGRIRANRDYSAAGFWDLFEDHAVSTPYIGCLVFWSDGGRITHVGICLDESFAFRAEGGDRMVKTEKDAELRNAYIKLRPLGPLGGTQICGYVDPFLKP